MKKERQYTEEEAYEYALGQYKKLVKRKQKSLATKIFKQCAQGGKPQKRAKQLQSLRTMELQLVFLKEHPLTMLPMPELDHSQTVEAWETGIADYKHDLNYTAKPA